MSALQRGAKAAFGLGWERRLALAGGSRDGLVGNPVRLTDAREQPTTPLRRIIYDMKMKK